MIANRCVEAQAYRGDFAHGPTLSKKDAMAFQASANWCSLGCVDLSFARFLIELENPILLNLILRRRYDGKRHV